MKQADFPPLILQSDGVRVESLAPANAQPWECPRCYIIWAPWVARCTCRAGGNLPPATPTFVPPPDLGLDSSPLARDFRGHTGR